MSWRTVIIASRCKLDYELGCMVVRGETKKRLYLDEIAVLMIENTAVAMTEYLIAELVSRKIKVIFCDEKRNPCAELVPYAGSHDSSRKIKVQIGWRDEVKSAVWMNIIAEKIARQAELLARMGKEREVEMLSRYIEELEFGDATNREGHAAKVYFNALFGLGFTRSFECPTNSALNYGYSLILSACNREVSANGYLNQIGIHHDNVFNAFNLGCDLMEPLRPLVDRLVVSEGFSEFGTEQKHDMIELLNCDVVIDGSRQTLLNGIKIYVRSVFAAMNDADTSLIRYCKYEL